MWHESGARASPRGSVPIARRRSSRQTGASISLGPVLARVANRRDGPLDLVAQRLEARRQHELLAEVLRVLVGGEAGAERGDLEQHAARLAEVDREEPEAVDD